MVPKSVIISLGIFAGVAFGQAGQGFTSPAMNDCGNTCLKQVQSLLGCDPTLLSCTCPVRASLAANAQFSGCLVDKCGSSDAPNVGVVIGENCAHYSWPVSTIGVGSSPTTTGSAAGAASPSPGAASPTSGTASSSSGAASPTSGAVSPTTSGSSSATGSLSSSSARSTSTKSPNAAARSGAGVAAAGLAMVAILAL